MSGFSFRPAVRENVGLLIGLAGGTGSGKTFTAMRLASGIAGDRSFAVIDTEAGRAKHYADRFRFDHGDLRAPFTPDAYAEAIAAADAAGYPVIVVDSASHEHAGDGGLLDWHDRELDRMAGDDWKKRDALTMVAWVKPKTSHKKMVQKLLQVRAHLILCFRAEEKIEIVKEADEHGKMKTKIQPKASPIGLHGWIPICEKTLPFELTASFLLTADAPGVPKPIKLQEQHRPLFPLDAPITEESGRAIAAWAAGGKAPRAAAPADDFDSRIATASTLPDLQVVQEAMSAAKASMTPERVRVLADAYRKRYAELHQSAAPPTFAQVAEHINKARNKPDVAAARTLAESVVDKAQRDDLLGMCAVRDGELQS